MKKAEEFPLCLRPSLFMIGQDSYGRWVARDQDGSRGGLFVDRAEALKFARAETGNMPHGIVMIGGVLELDLNGPKGLAASAGEPVASLH